MTGWSAGRLVGWLVGWLARSLARSSVGRSVGLEVGKGGGWGGKASGVSRAIAVEGGPKRGDGPRTWARWRDKWGEGEGNVERKRSGRSEEKKMPKVKGSKL